MIGRIIAAGLAFTLLVVTAVLSGVGMSYARQLPVITQQANLRLELSTHVFARNGLLLANLHRQNRTWAPLEHIPFVVRNAFIANEDQYFYENDGIDAGGIIRAAWADWHHQPLQGASTITQQLARGMFLSDKITLSRKLKEALLALELTHYYTKDEILERYLNRIYLGSGSYGVEAAARTYFGTTIGHVSLAQAAMLAGLAAAPSDYSPFVNLRLAKQRQAHVLDRMVACGYIDAGEARAAKRAPLHLAAQQPAGIESYRFPYFTTYAVHVLKQTFGEKPMLEDGLNVYTTLSPRMQNEAQRAVDWGLDAARNGGIDGHEAALVAIRPSTGEILAMVGGKAYTLRDQFNRAWQAVRQPGSSFKPYVYTAAIDSGLTPATIVNDDPVSYPMGNGTMWSPQDDDHSFLGPITLRYALAQSRNVVAVKLAREVGIDKVIAYAKSMGIKDHLNPNLSLALGTSGVTPLEQASGYATLAYAGIHVAPSPLRLVTDAGNVPVLDNRQPDGTSIVSAATAYVVTSMLESVIKNGTGNPNAQIGRPAAGKTGTTSDFRDAWFVGYTPDLVAAVWMGNDNDSPMNDAYGGDIPAQIWARFMRAALHGTPKHDFSFPEGEVKKITLCSGRSEVFVAGTEPYESCGGPPPRRVEAFAPQPGAADDR